MDGSVRQILDPRILTQSYSQLPGDVLTPLTDAFFTPTSPEEIDDDSFRSMYDSADLQAAPGNIIGAEARVLTFGNAKERIFNMFYSFNQTVFPEQIMRALREPASYQLQKMGRTEISRVMTKYRNAQRRFKELAIAKVITQGVVYMNPAGQILESSTGAAMTADFEVPAGNKGNLGGLITALLSVAGTDIPAILETIDDAAAAASVPAPTDVWVNKANLGSLRNNNAFKYWAQNNQEISRGVLKDGARVFEDLWGKRWHFVNTYYTAADGTTKPFIPKTGQGSIVLTPPVTGSWLKTANGLSLLPKDLNPVSDIDQAINNLIQQYGMFAYAQAMHNPVRVAAFMGDKFGFNFNEPGAIWMGTAF